MVGGLRAGVFALAAFVLGCGNVPTPVAADGGGGQGGMDSGADVAADTAPHQERDASGDAAACECRVEDFTLRMSWACFCAKFGCGDREPACPRNRTTSPACGLTADNLQNIAGPAISVWDQTGALV